MNADVQRVVNEAIRVVSDKSERRSEFGKDEEYSMEVFLQTKNKKIMLSKEETRDNELLGQGTRFVIKGDILSNDETTVEECGFTENIILNVVAQITKVKVECYDGRTIFIDVYKNDKLINVEKKIRRMIRFNKDEHRLEYDGSIIEYDDKRDIEGGMSVRNGLKIVEKLKNGTLKDFQMINGRKVTLDVTKSDKILDIKRKIQDRIKISMEGLRLVIDDVELKDGQTLEECNAWDKRCITILLKDEIRIFVQTLDGNRCIIYTSKRKTILYIMKMIQEMTGLHPDEQELIYQGKELLEDDKTVEECRIFEKSVIIARLRGGMQIFAKTMDGKIVALETNIYKTILDIKKKIQERVGLLPDDQKLVYQGQLLEDDKTVEECQICEKSIINVVQKLRGPMIIFARHFDKDIALEILQKSTVFEIKKKIQEKTGLSVYVQVLIHRGLVLFQNYKTVEECGICEKSIINVAAIMRGGGGIQVYIETFDGETLTIIMSGSETIFDMKKRIQEETGISPENQDLLYKGRLLEDYKTVDESQISKSSSTNAVLILKKYFKINFELEYGKSFSLRIHNKDKVIDIKNRIFTNVRLPVIDQTVLYRGKILGDDKTVVECGIIGDCEVKVEVLRRNIKIKVEEVEGTFFEMTISNLSKVREVKERIEQNIGVALRYQELWSGACKMEDDEEMLCFCSVTEGSVIKLYRKIIIHIHPSDMESFSLEVSKTDKILEVKRKIQEMTGFNPRDQILMHQRGLMVDHEEMVEEVNIPGENSMVVTVIFKGRRRRGACVIINNENFKGAYKRRTGTEKDEENIRKTFESMGYEVKIHRDVVSRDMSTIIDQSKRCVNDSDKILITFILSHGVKEGIVSADEKLFSFKNIWTPFSNKYFSELSGKPKLFFFTCCRGTLTNESVKGATSSNIEHDGLPHGEHDKVPSMGDIFLGFATCEGYTSLRYTKYGTPYITHLCDVIRENPLWSISDIHQEVQTRVSASEIKDNMFQMPCSENMLRKHAYFLTSYDMVTD